MMSPDIYPPTGAYQHPRDKRLEARNVHGQQKEAKRQHPEPEDREDGKETANDEHARDRDPKLAKAPAQ